MIAAIGFVMALATAGTVWAERYQPSLRRPLKMVAATGFVAVALVGEAYDTTFGRIMLAGLALAWIGDLALTYSGKRAFVIGLGAFLAAHVMYSVAFAFPAENRELDWRYVVIAAALVGTLGALIARRLLPAVAPDLKGPVIGYMVAISVMVTLAFGHLAGPIGGGAAAARHLDWRIVVGATLFYVSDLAVARDRFVAPGWGNRVWGLPAYFAGQFLLAWAAGGPLLTVAAGALR